MTNKIKLSNQKIVILLISLALLILIPFVVNLARQKQEVRKRAEGSGIVKVKLDPVSDSKSPGETINIKVIMEATQASKIGAANVKLLFDTGIFNISTPTCGTKFPMVAGNSADNNAGTIYLGCSINAGTSGIDIPAGQTEILGQFNATIKNTESLGTTHQIRFAVAAQLPYVSDYNTDANLSDAGTPGTYTIGAGPTPTWTPDERCRLSTDKQNYAIGEQITVYVSQNPKHAGTDDCYYRSLEVKEGTQLRCTASGFGVNARTQSCFWNTSGTTLGNHELKTVYGGHSDNCPAGPCCDSGYDCYTTVTLRSPPTATPTPTPTPTGMPTATPTPTTTPIPGPTATPTTTPIPTPTVTVPPGQVKIQVKIKYAKVAEQKPDQTVKVRIVKNKIVLQELPNLNLTATADGDGVYRGLYQSAMITLSSAITEGSGHTIFIKGTKHLQIRYCKNSGQTRPCLSGNINLANGENVLDFSKYPLPGGDLPHPVYGQDGVVNAIDAVLLENCLKEDPEGQTCIAQADLNFDKNIDTRDIEILNWTIFTRYEDREDE